MTTKNGEVWGGRAPLHANGGLSGARVRLPQNTVGANCLAFKSPSPSECHELKETSMCARLFKFSAQTMQLVFRQPG